MTLLLPLMGFLFVSLLVTAVGMLLLRGETSDLLSPATTTSMSLRGPKARLVTLPEVGHAPMLDRPAQWAPVEAFLS